MLTDMLLHLNSYMRTHVLVDAVDSKGGVIRDHARCLGLETSEEKKDEE